MSLSYQNIYEKVLPVRIFINDGYSGKLIKITANIIQQKIYSIRLKIILNYYDS